MIMNIVDVKVTRDTNASTLTLLISYYVEKMSKIYKNFVIED
jgi:hypothetical protein